MKREEEILQAAKKEAWYIADTSQTKEEAAISGYCLGAKYADKTLIDKACEWLWYEIYERIDDSKIKESLYEDSYRANLVDAFKEAMEE